MNVEPHAEMTPDPTRQAVDPRLSIVPCGTPPCTAEAEFGLYGKCGHGPVLVCGGCKKRIDRWMVNNPDQKAVCETCRAEHPRPLKWRRV